jgi:2-amino-4-hydroxy-6-hydroxymethyldihydropteridine diphosphokinase
MNKAYLLIGGNMGDRESYLSKAKTAIEKECGKIIKQSAIYETEAWGMTEQSAFLNQALAVQTRLDPEELLYAILTIEEKLGRKREIKYGPRIIDIDILLFNNEIINIHNLRIPHPEMQNRRFALQCLNDIASKKNHPVFRKTIAQLLAECTDPLTVNKFS